MIENMRTVTALLGEYRNGNRDAFDQLVSKLYSELRELAHIQLAQRRPGQTLDTTALVNELYCKIADQDAHQWKDRDHFYAVCATTMRHLVIDMARRRLRVKRGGGEQQLTLDEERIAAEGDPEWLIELDRLMERLGDENPRLVQIFECRYFAGYTTADTARILGLSERTVERDWARARAWLRHALAIPKKSDRE